LTLASDGNFYGTTFAGGTQNRGTVFRITPAGNLTSLASFTDRNGASPQGKLVTWFDGSLYGTTYSGGASVIGGTIFRLTTSGVLSSVLSFGATEPCFPSAGLTLASDGYFYGVTGGGGAATRFGTVFKAIVPPVISDVTQFGRGISFRVTTVPGSTNRVWSSSTLSLPVNQWQAIGTNIANPQGRFTFTENNPGTPRNFFRVSIP